MKRDGFALLGVETVSTHEPLIHRFRSIVQSYQRIYPEFNVDIDAELQKWVNE